MQNQKELASFLEKNLPAKTSFILPSRRMIDIIAGKFPFLVTVNNSKLIEVDYKIRDESFLVKNHKFNTYNFIAYVQGVLDERSNSFYS